jgi:hypothetical protein
MTKITAQPRLNSETEYLEAFAKQTLRKDRGPWIMCDPNDNNPPENVTRGLVLFYSGAISPSDDMSWCWGGSSDEHHIAAYYPLEVATSAVSDEMDDPNHPYLFWNGRWSIPTPVDPYATVEVIFRDHSKGVDPASQYAWQYASDSTDPWDIVAYRVLKDSTLREGVWHGFSGSKDDRLPEGIQPHTKVSLRLRDGYETSYGPASSWDWSVDHKKPVGGDVIAFKIED